MNRVNENKIKFRKLFMVMASQLKSGAFIGDQSLENTCLENGINLRPLQIQECIRSLEVKIGRQYRLRLARVRSEGYQVLEGDEQYHKASDECAKKVVKTCKKAATRV